MIVLNDILYLVDAKGITYYIVDNGHLKKGPKSLDLGDNIISSTNIKCIVAVVLSGAMVSVVSSLTFVVTLISLIVIF